MRNLTNEWQQLKQHLHTELQHLRAEFPPYIAFILLSRYSNKSLINHVNATKNDPRLSDPKLYLIVHQNPVLKLKLPAISSYEVKYQLLTATIMTYLNMAVKSSAIQKSPKM